MVNPMIYPLCGILEEVLQDRCLSRRGGFGLSLLSSTSRPLEGHREA